MRKFRLEHHGELPAYVAKYILPYDGEEVNEESLAALDEDIRFLTCDLKECHGNTDNGFPEDRAGWLCPLTTKEQMAGTWNMLIWIVNVFELVTA